MLKVQNIKTYILTFPSRSIKSELMVATTVHTAYKTLVWNAEHKKKQTIFTDNKKRTRRSRSYVPLAMSILSINVLNYINQSTQTRQFGFFLNNPKK